MADKLEHEGIPAIDDGAGTGVLILRRDRRRRRENGQKAQNCGRCKSDKAHRIPRQIPDQRRLGPQQGLGKGEKVPPPATHHPPCHPDDPSCQARET
jgi:hypothetical protein